MGKITITKADGTKAVIDDNLDNEFLEDDVTPYTKEDDKKIEEDSKKLRDKLAKGKK